ncbi:MAG TPA: hypothetical protein PKH98_00795, partial [Candidatus Omnitrophota bacterium]|nr:hypothetical protein [Candidatus Omnitrophota bacterium]
EKIQKVYLKAPIAFPLTIRFVEKRKKDTIRTTMVIASEIPDYVENLKTMIVPESLNDFDIYTNDIERAQKLFSDKKALRVFEKYKNMTLHGAPLMSLSFIEGMIILEFQALVVMNPNLPTLKKDIHILENYIDHLLVLIAALEK